MGSLPGTADKGAPRSRIPKQLDMEPKLRLKGRAPHPTLDESHLPRRTPNYSPYRDKATDPGYRETDEQRDLRKGFRRV